MNHIPTSSRSSKSKTKSRTRPLSQSPEKTLSAAYIDSDVDQESGNALDEPDSDVDLETVTPRRAAAGTAAGKTPSSSRFRPYAPPVGMSPLEVNASSGTSAFEWDALARRPGVEIWALRVPSDLKMSRLTSLAIQLPSSSSTLTGTLKTKSRSYTVVPVGHATATTVINEQGRVPTAGPGMADALTMDVDADERDLRIEGGEEMDGLRLLLPRMRDKGKLFLAPLPIKRNLLLTPDPLPTPVETSSRPLPGFLSNGSTSGATDSTAIIKRPQPIDLLKFRHRVSGFDTPGPQSKEKVTDPSLSTNKVKKKRKSDDGKEESPRKKKVKV